MQRCVPLLSAVLALVSVGARPLAQEAEAPLTGAELEQVIESLALSVEENYIFPDVAAEIGAKLREELWAGNYEDLSRGGLATRLTNHLRSVNDDRHLGVRPVPPEDRDAREEDPEVLRRRRLENARRGNYGFQKLEILEGNVGYLDLRGFNDTSIAGDTAVAAMAFLANTDAVIIDLRQNGGGSPSMIQLLSSYFFEEPVHLNSFQYRKQEQIDQFWTLPHVPGRKLVDTPLFILTSNFTFSAAEEFTYNMKNLERATIVGQTTGGGAHPGGTHDVEGVFSVFIPDGRAINPITGTNWEGTGIPPHVETPREKALEVAHRAARDALRKE